ncbi:hypothetical protein NQ318_010508, partial [Aromia moschata]
WDSTLGALVFLLTFRFLLTTSWQASTTIRGITCENETVSELYGFCDSSKSACVIYLRQISATRTVSVSFLCARSRVAPLKRISLPRLELCGAVLLADLIDFVQSGYQGYIVFDKVYAWSDSTVSLSWIRSHPHRWKTFIANRVTRIQEKKIPQTARLVDYFPKSFNLIRYDGRGHPDYNWMNLYGQSNQICHAEVKEEQGVLVCVSRLGTAEWVCNVLTKFSSLRKIKRVIAYCQRFVRNCRTESKSRATGGLSASELERALLVVVKVIQCEVFEADIKRLEAGKPYVKSLQKLSPFIDRDGAVKVGRRLRHSDLSHDAKHPLLLSRSHRITELIISDVHQRNLHCGPNTTKNLLAQQFWILGVKRESTFIHYKCKWYSSTNDNTKVGTLVIINDSSAPLHWKLGRIIKLYPGRDGISRVAQDVRKLIKRLSNVVNDYLIPYEYFNHGDFLFATDVRHLLYNEMFQTMNRY